MNSNYNNEQESFEFEGGTQNYICEQCHQQIDILELSNHDQNCSQQNQICDQCQEQFPKSLINFHKSYCKMNSQGTNSERSDSFISFASKEDEFYKQNDMNDSQQSNSSSFHLENFHDINQEIQPDEENKESSFSNENANQSQFDLLFNQILIIQQRLRKVIGEEQGLKQDIIDQYPTFIYQLENLDQDQSNKIEQKKCMICLEDFQGGDTIKILPCYHKYHSICIEQWLKVSSICPLCKADLGEDKNNKKQQFNNLFILENQNE